MKHTSPTSITLLILLALLAVSSLRAQSDDSTWDMIERNLLMVDLTHFEWDGAPEPMRPRLGVYVQPVPADSFAMIAGFPKEVTAANRVWHIMPHWSVDEGGMLIGDILLAMNGGPLSDSLYSFDEFLNMRVREMRPGDTVRFTILRDGAVRELPVPLLAATRVPMDFFTSALDNRAQLLFEPPADNSGNVPVGTSWLESFLRERGLLEWARTIQKQIRTISDQDFCTVPFAGRPNPWRLQDVTYLQNHPTHVGAMARYIADDLWTGFAQRKLPGALATAGVHLDHFGLYLNKDVDAIRTAKDLTRYLDTAQHYLDEAYAPIAGDLDSIAARLMRLLDISNDWEGNLDSVPDAVARRELRLREERRVGALFGAVDKVNMDVMLGLGDFVAGLADSAWLLRFVKGLESSGTLRRTTVAGVEGEVLMSWRTPRGVCVIGGRGANRYTGDFRLIIDLGGDDIYELPQLRTGAVRFVADMAGDDLYRSSGSGQGAGIAGIDILADLSGDDIYRGVRFSQGAGLLGVGLLADYAGNDIYTSRWCSQGAAFHGIGILYEGGGDDSYTADMYAQGFGYIRGFGAIMEGGGNDSYRAGWRYADNRIPHKGYLAMSQGFGFGMRPWATGIGADGGIGVISDLHGDDLYASDFFSQGGSYWYALGILHDAEGTDRYTAGQYSQGSGIHLSFGALLDDEGDDTYDAYAGLEQGNAHDWSAGCLEDRSGNDTYRGSNSSQGSALNVSIAWLLDGGGNDGYYALLTDSTLSQGGGNVNRARRSGGLGLLIDRGAGNDYYVDPRALPGSPVVKGNGILFDDGPAAKDLNP